MNADPVSALATVVVPFGIESEVEETLFQLMSGACDALRDAGCALGGGHSGEGAELSLGFSVTGEVEKRFDFEGKRASNPVKFSF